MTLSNDERRRERRYLAAELLRVSFRRGLRRHSTFAILEDISLTGCLMILEEALALGTDVRLHSHDQAVEGQVRHCTLREDGRYIAGVQLKQSSGQDRAADREQRWNSEF